MERYQRTIAAMTRLHCHDIHGTQSGLCPNCQAFLEYAYARLERCRYAPKKPACDLCPIHCYKPQMREQAREIMRYAGPRMLTRHPLLAILHLWDRLQSKRRVALRE